MNESDSKPTRRDVLDRLLRSAALVKDDPPSEPPFGFETRVVALWRGLGSTDPAGVMRLVRRVAVIATGIIIIAAAGTYWEASQDRETNDSFANEFAIADSAIESELPQ